ncbi:MAG: hypothetical protein RIS44_2586 [Pseudomonadota bacterium]|jgi:CPA2 family monovalent cation:H+ antiporter-2
MALNPLLFSLVEPLQRWICERSALARRLQARDDPLATLPTNTADKFLAQQVVLVGYGRVGRHIAAALAEQGQAFVVADHNRERVAQLRAAGIAAVHGDATDPAVLIQAHIAQARLLVIATAASVDARPMIETARTLNPGIQTVVRALSDEEAHRLQADGAVQALVAETELARAVVQRVQTALQAPRA